MVSSSTINCVVWLPVLSHGAAPLHWVVQTTTDPCPCLAWVDIGVKTCLRSGYLGQRHTPREKVKFPGVEILNPGCAIELSEELYKSRLHFRPNQTLFKCSRGALSFCQLGSVTGWQDRLAHSRMGGGMGTQKTVDPFLILNMKTPAYLWC